MMNFDELVGSIRFLDVEKLSYEQLKRLEGPLKSKLFLVQRYIELNEEKDEENY